MYQRSLLQDYRGPPNPVILPNPVRAAETRPAVAKGASTTTAQQQPAEAAIKSRVRAGDSSVGSQNRVSVFRDLVTFMRIDPRSFGFL